MNDQSESEQNEIEKAKPFWLSDNFAPTLEECSKAKLEVTGSIPPELNGRFLRNGANPQSGESAHWFLGDGMIHGVELQNGKANWYRNRYVRTPNYVDKGANPLSAITDLSNSTANTHIIAHAGKILALEESGWPFEVSPDLETVGAHDFDGKLTTAMTAHPKTCPETGELLFFGYGIAPPYMTYHRVSADGSLVQSEEIDVKGATMVHDFNITRNYVIFMDLPLVWNLENVEGGLPIQWSDEYGARLGVMPRDGSNTDVVWYDIDPCYVFHPMNAHEDGDDIVIDVCRSAQMMKPGVRDAPTFLHRWTIHQKSGRVSESQLDDIKGVEFPRVPDRLIGQPYRFGYAAEFGDDGPSAIGYRKYDMTRGTSTAHELKNGRTGSEAVFVPAADAGAEDDGYLLTFVHDPADDKSELVILDASHLEKDPIARIHLQARVPHGFHGNWIADRA